MANGKGCTCCAYSENECACDADWTDQETIDLRQKVTAQQARIAELRESLRATTEGLEWRWESIANRAAPLHETAIDEAHTKGIEALMVKDDLSALEAAKQQARRDALMEAAEWFDIMKYMGCSDQLRRMAGEVKP